MSAGPEYTIAIRRVQDMIELGRRLNLDVETLLTEASIEPMLLDEGRSRATAAQASTLIRHVWQVTDDELLGLGLQPVPRGTFRLVCFGLLSAADVGTALRRFESFNKSLPGVPPVMLSEDAGVARVSFDISAVSQPVGLAIDTMLAVVHRFIGWAIRRRVALLGVEVPYRADPELDDYDLLFGAPVRFSAPAPALMFDAEVLSAPIVRSEQELMEFLRDAPAGVLERRDYGVSLTSQVRRILQRGPAGDWPSVEDTAAELAMSPQTLRRKLREENTSARDIREDILRDAAIASLVRGDETVAALSRRLGFSEPSAFSRAFRRWTGSAPGSYQH
ncbi:hypothetical protein A5740_15405 [Mycobacterium sp. GA-1841]|uniref:AraC family transcriptional regulator n=1 Tax=Mycobacterium sp. GA-1841 TaxID=1834154 RepID=UPI00096E5D28|nr:AraC family transcriptional regulator [Mycobacterium sp. GA-1841]OMC31219.1 hypothetical protein A5740_15405 [Mycobacterium sp. GA-1841]